jgi:SAM-dependent methyltransferase
MLDTLPEIEGSPVLEIGSGAGFLKEHLPSLIASDVLHIPAIDVVLNGSQLPFAPASYKAILLINVLHHIPDPKGFLDEASRCVQTGGVLALIEPWVTPWSKLIYKYLHHEPFDTDVKAWELPLGGPLSNANSALPWIIFERDAEILSEEFPEWRINEPQPFMPFRYLLSGGMTLRSMMPFALYPFWKYFEDKMQPWSHRWGMFAQITLKRK